MKVIANCNVFGILICTFFISFALLPLMSSFVGFDWLPCPLPWRKMMMKKNVEQWNFGTNCTSISLPLSPHESRDEPLNKIKFIWDYQIKIKLAFELAAYSTLSTKTSVLGKSCHTIPLKSTHNVEELFLIGTLICVPKMVTRVLSVIRMDGN
jgi:hypothetical protein